MSAEGDIIRASLNRLTESTGWPYPDGPKERTDALRACDELEAVVAAQREALRLIRDSTQDWRTMNIARAALDAEGVSERDAV